METKKLLQIALIIGLTSLVNCKKEETNKIITPKQVTIENKQVTNLNDIKFEVSSIQQKVIDSIDYYPKSKIDILINGKRYEIAKVSGEGNIIDKSEFINNNVPKTAISACMSWWAGSGDFFYVEEKENKAIIYKGWDGEGNEDNTGKNWEVAKKIDLK